MKLKYCPFCKSANLIINNDIVNCCHCGAAASLSRWNKPPRASIILSKKDVEWSAYDQNSEDEITIPELVQMLQEPSDLKKENKNV